MANDLNKDIGSERLVVTDDLFNSRQLYYDLHRIETVNECFAMEMAFPFTSQAGDIHSAAMTLRGPPNYWDVYSLFKMAVKKQLTENIQEEIYEFGQEDIREHQQIWRDFGFPEVAEILDTWDDLHEEVEIRIVREKDYTWADFVNREDIERRSKLIASEMKLLSPSITFSEYEVKAMICDKFHLDPRPPNEFTQFWVSKIQEAPGFADFESGEEEDDWLLDRKPFGWLTVRHGAALEKHGFKFKFSFWEQELGDSRGHLWIQTDQGPLRLTDYTDSISLRTYFPIQVSNVSGDPLFELQEKDVPDALMQPGVYPYPEKHAHKYNTNWNAFWKRFMGKK